MPTVPIEAITTAEAAEMAGVHYETIRNWRKRGYLRAWKVGGTYRYSRQEVVAFLNGDPHAGSVADKPRYVEGER